MYILDIDKKTGFSFKTAFTYLLLSCLCALFGAVYELYSHGVYSFYMIYAFAFPLVGGALPFCAIGLLRIKKYPYSASRNIYHSGVATLTVGSIIQGVLEIYGTTNSLIKYYWIVGIILVLTAILLYLVQIIKSKII